MSDERLRILEMIETGQISTEHALQLLDALDEADIPDEIARAAEQQGAPDDPRKPGDWWLYLIVAGAVVMAIGAPLMALGITGRAAVFWAICCGWIPFLAGLFILTAGAWSRRARWFHLRIRNARSGRHAFALSLPLPLTLTAWVLRIARLFVPQLNETSIDEAILALRDGLREGDDQPLFIDVRNDDDEQVMIWLA